MPSLLRHTRSQRGSILFMILLAVVLFAALNYAVTSSNGGDTKNASSESADAAAAEILGWFASLDSAIMRMKLNGIAYEDMSFGYQSYSQNGAVYSTNYIHNTRCVTTTCMIFKSDGGGVKPPDFSQYAPLEPTGWTPTYLKAGLSYIKMMQWPGAGSPLNDVVLYIQAVRPEICASFNSKIGISSMPSSTGPFVDGHVVSSWDNSATIFTNPSTLYGKDSFAAGNSGSGAGLYCNIYHVAIKR